jgi:hypothetical protein
MTTGMEGLFPSNYVEEVPSQSPPVPSYGQPPSAKNYGNMPLDVSQSGQPANPAEPKQNKFEEGGKKFGKKLGNAGMLDFCFQRSHVTCILTDNSNLRRRCHCGFQYCEQHLLIS